MNTIDAKNISLVDYLQSVGITPCKKQDNNVWYFSPFRNESEPSFKVNLARNLWYDFGLGKGGNLIEFIMEQHGIDSVSHALQILSGTTSTVPAHSFSFRPQENLPCFEDIRIQALENPSLIQYLKERQINIPFAEQACKEVHFRFKDKPYFAIGFENALGGYELRNKYFQGTLSPKTFTQVKNGNDTCCIFEGFIDYLSYLTLRQRYNSSIDNQDYIILNSVANVSKAIDIISNYQEKQCYLDNDKAGASAYIEIRNKCGLNVLDKSSIYRGHKDLNDYLCGKKQDLELPVKKKKPGLKL